MENKHTYSCKCHTGYHGDHCEKGPCYTAAGEEVCQNSGKCNFSIDKLSNTIETHCSCLNGYTGAYCETNVCSADNLCAYGECVNKVELNSGYECKCDQHYHHDELGHCTVSKCTPINPCENGGTCELAENGERVCTCQLGYSGEVCVYDSCSGVLCGDHGQCQVNVHDLTK